MNLQVINRELSVGNIEIAGVASSSLVLIGDADIIQLTSAFDTPPESLIVGPFVPLTPKG
ncbi:MULTISPECIES: spore gernimation protein GerPD [Rossellomorea]|jgi:spore germination protein PD|uniref:spore gernimation protein GerPD n=1 Tax=Rossellomorea TaxID=2837508 RepID=UPI001CCA90E2|nr:MULTISPECIES: spore gernimation protein GerPD [Rossellomorea]MCA0149010.1 spore gernimation protein GerPD [Rossellomorea vietnamensis]MCC5803010.1 spore gernimation protein GerPD [Rossellomorea vietnamensis]UTE79091.1 spore gernimation protein GerPD [Rossellomorea sp. KS-H15a]WGG47158.1 spore gernimation protein GerPD [Rossellomorea sp. DA94]